MSAPGTLVPNGGLTPSTGSRFTAVNSVHAVLGEYLARLRQKQFRSPYSEGEIFLSLRGGLRPERLQKHCKIGVFLIRHRSKVSYGVVALAGTSDAGIFGVSSTTNWAGL